MKKRINKISLIFIIIILMFTGCNKKVSITNSDFEKVFKDKGYTIYNVTTQFSKKESVKSVILAQINNEYQIEFYTLKNVKEAIKLFDNNMKTFDNDSISSKKIISKNNYSIYSSTNLNYYMYLSRIDNTLLYIKVPKKYKNDINIMIDDLGY